MQTHFSERQSFAVQSRLSVFTHGSDEIIVAGIGIRDGLGWTLKPPPQEIDKPVEITRLKNCDCGFESRRTLSYRSILSIRQSGRRGLVSADAKVSELDSS